MGHVLIVGAGPVAGEFVRHAAPPTVVSIEWCQSSRANLK